MNEVILNPDALGPKALQIQEFMLSRIIGQDDAVHEIVRLYQQQRSGLCYPGSPLGKILLLGPTGTGKTEIVDVFAEALHGDKKKRIRIDCAEYQADHQIANIVGSPKGYYDSEKDPVFTEKKLADIQGEEFISIVSFDEEEKASPALRRLLLGILDKATLTTNKGKVRFDRSFIFLTSNIGTKEIESAYTPGIGFGHGGVKQVTSREIEKLGHVAARKKYPPEFFNRLDAVCVFKGFTRETVGRILDMEMKRMAQIFMAPARPELKPFTFELLPEARELILDHGYDVKMNARFLKRAITRLFLQKISNILESGQIAGGDHMKISRDGNRLAFTKTTS